MKLGIVSTILSENSFEEMIDHISSLGYEAVEVACWPQGVAERRYAGVSHIDVVNLTPTKAEELLAYAHAKGVHISALGYYPNPLDSNLKKRTAVIEHLYAVIDAANLMKINLVTTFIGRDQFKTIEENLQLVKEVWTPILTYAQEKGVKIGIENCPMLFGPDQWPGGQNIFTTPALWKQIFELLPFENLGINYDPSHFIWQQIDYIKPIYTFKDKIFHVHFKDIKLSRDRLNDHGIMAYPLSFMEPKLPGLGDVNWGRFVSALTDIRFNGFACVEIEDRAFEQNAERIIDSMALSYRYLRQFVI